MIMNDHFRYTRHLRDVSATLVVLADYLHDLYPDVELDVLGAWHPSDLPMAAPEGSIVIRRVQYELMEIWTSMDQIKWALVEMRGPPSGPTLFSYDDIRIMSLYDPGFVDRIVMEVGEYIHLAANRWLL